MSLSSYISFFILVFAIVYSPGPMTMFMMANGIKMQYRNIFPILIGANNAYLLSILVFTVGLTQLLQQHTLIMKSIQIGGIIYLVYLAWCQWYTKKIPSGTLEVRENPGSLYVKGALIALSNPKTILLFGVIFPQFVIEDETRLMQILILGITFLILQFSSGCIYAYFGKRIKTLMEKPEYQGLINKIAALALLMVAGFLLARI